MYTLYLKSIVRGKKTVLLGFVIIISSLILSCSVFAVLFDCAANGEITTALEDSNGAVLWIYEADTNDIAYFGGITGAKLEYSDRIIFVKTDSGEAEAKKIYAEARQIISDNKLDLSMTWFGDRIYHPVMSDPAVSLPFSFVFVFFSALPMFLALRLVIRLQKRNIAILRMLGAEKNNILTVYILEYISLFIISFVLSVLAGNLIVYILSKTVMTINNASMGLGRIVYRFSNGKTIETFLLSFVAYLFTSFAAITAENNEGKDKYVTIKRFDIPPKTLLRRFLRERYYKRDSMLLPIMVMSLCPIFIMNIVLLSAMSGDYRTLYDTDIMLIGNLYTESGIITDEQLDEISGFACVKSVDSISQDSAFYTESVHPDMSDAIHSHADGYWVKLSTIYDDDYTNGKIDLPDSGFEKEGSVLIADAYKNEVKRGDVISLYKDGRYFRDVIIAGYYRTDLIPSTIGLYCTKRNYETITGSAFKATSASVRLKSNTSADELKVFRKALSDIFNGTDVTVRDETLNKSELTVIQKGLKMICSITAFVNTAAAITVVSAFVYIFAVKRQNDYKTMADIGIDKECIRRLSINESLKYSASGVIAGDVLGFAVSAVILNAGKAADNYSLPVIVLYIFITAATIAAAVTAAAVSTDKVMGGQR